jgi:site-specific DNA-methyltransferase (adenine-specific)
VSSSRIITGDARIVVAGLPERSVDAVVTDSPYELGFMGKAWDRSGIAFDPAFWRLVMRVLKPGGHLVSFGGSRTYHRIACAIEDGGFEMRDMLEWFYGSGFPKSLNLGDGRGTALKPAHEPIALAMRPLDGTFEENLARWGTGALYIDACRIPFADEADEREAKEKNQHGTFDSGARGSTGIYGAMDRPRDDYNAAGRWPANLLFDDDAARVLDEQTGDLGVSRSGVPAGRRGAGFGHKGGTLTAPVGFGDRGGASRFFYRAKAAASEREFGLGEGFPLRSGGELTDREDGTAALSSPRSGAGRGGGRRNVHPTVKPIDVMRWLARLITPPGGLVLDPFCGSGSTGIAARLEGFDFIGVEQDAYYADIARARIAAWVGEPAPARTAPPPKPTKADQQVAFAFGGSRE